MTRVESVAVLVLTASLVGFGPRARAADPVSHIEKIEWTWSDRPAASDARLPNVLLLGDSITRGYYDATAELLQGKANVYLFATSAAVGSAMLLDQIHDYAKMTGLRFALVHLNNGMHGSTYSEADYRAHYPAFLAAVKSQWPTANCIVATTTPVLTDSADGPPNARIVARNTIAAADAARSGCAIDDQYALMLQHQDLHDGNVHYTAAGSRVQAEQVLKSVLQGLGTGH